MKNYLKIALTLFAAYGSYVSQAQVLNGGFELTRPDSTIANWEVTSMIVMPLDSPACSYDSLYFLNNDPHSGKYALELRNIACYGATSSARMFASDDIPAFGPSEPFTQRPEAFSFFYKFFPLHGEGIRMSISLLDAEMNVIATVDSTFFPGTVSSYTQAVMPLQYSSTQQPERMRMQFLITDNGGGTGNLEAGCRFLIDDIGTTGAVTAIKEQAGTGSAFRCYPTIATNNINLELAGYRGQSSLQLWDAAGRLVRYVDHIYLVAPVQLDIQDLPQGMYFVRVVNAAGQYNSRFVRR